MNARRISNLYHNAQLCLAAIRILEHQRSKPPAIEDVCRILNCSLEQATYILRKLEDLGAVDIVEGAFGTRLFILDHLKAESLPRDETDNRLDEALKQFQTSRRDHTKKIAAIQADQKKKRQDLFANLEKKLKKNLEK